MTVTPTGATMAVSSPGLPQTGELGDLRLANLTKSFGRRTVLDHVGFDVPAGQVVGLLGQNGSGKSTLIKVLTGYHHPDHGSGACALLDCTEISLPMHRDSGYSVAAVHQDLGLAAQVSVTENLLMSGKVRSPLSPVKWTELHKRAHSMLVKVGGGDIDPRAEVGSLRPVQRAAVAVARAVGSLGDSRGLLILDEVTAFMPDDAISQLFDIVRVLTRRGISVLFVSHRMEEVSQICDRVVVLRGGKLVRDSLLSDATEEELITDIVGASLGWLYPDKHPAGAGLGMSATGITGGGLRNVHLHASRGEIVGLTGLKGMGHDRMIYALFGEIAGAQGSLEVSGSRVPLGGLSPRKAIELGVRLVPSDRLRNGAVAGATVRENASLPHLSRFFSKGFFNHAAERRWALDLILAYDVTPDDPELPYAALSGGNQQKVLMARWLESDPAVLLLDEPTQGVDVGARRAIFSRITAAAEKGTAILYASTEAQDLAELCHRVVVFRDGSVAGELSGPDVTETNISRLCWASSTSSGSSQQPVA